MQPICNSCHRSGEWATYYCTTSGQKTQHPVCREYFVSGLKKEHVVRISQKRYHDRLGLPFEQYSAILDDNTRVVVEHGLSISCKYIVPFKDTYMSKPIHVSYFEVVKKIFQEINQMG